jgi:hypothetical protein
MSQEALTRLLVEKGFTKEGCLKMGRVADKEMRREKTETL